MICTNCKAEIPNQSKFCMKCGKQMGSAPASQAPPAPPPAPPAPCSKCGAELPAGSKFCLKCGQQVPLEPEIPVSPPVTFCDCGTKLPQASFFCPMCGKAVNVGPNHPLAPSLRKRKHPARFLIWLIIPIALGGAAWWAATSNNDTARQIQRFVVKAHDEAITPTVLSVKPRGFASYKFIVPFGATDVSVDGEFTATGDAASEVEVLIFKDDAFVDWQGGYSPSSYYSSGRVKQADIKASLPAGPGTYYVVFNNNFSTRTAKSVQADVTLHYSRFWPQL